MDPIKLTIDDRGQEDEENIRNDVTADDMIEEKGTKEQSKDKEKSNSNDEEAIDDKAISNDEEMEEDKEHNNVDKKKPELPETGTSDGNSNDDIAIDDKAISKDEEMEEDKEHSNVDKKKPEKPETGTSHSIDHEQMVEVTIDPTNEHIPSEYILHNCGLCGKKIDKVLTPAERYKTKCTLCLKEVHIHPHKKCVMKLWKNSPVYKNHPKFPDPILFNSQEQLDLYCTECRVECFICKNGRNHVVGKQF